MKSTFQMSDLGLLSFYLGIEVRQGEGAITLHQSTKKILELAGMADCNSADMPMEERLHLSKDSTTEMVNATEYRPIVGCLSYLVHTRPDISFTVGFVSRFMERPTDEHQRTVKRLLRYIGYGLRYEHRATATWLIGYSDADLASDIDTRKSTSGVLFFLGDCLTSWQSVKQKVVALSSCESEYVATTTAATQEIWLARLLGDLLG
ncbi:hypothetical protein BS78_09G086000 [Paspalum vaginatum]|nr:hypothetical protein BS78_09G086000 [Paspalum vaginatum]